MRFEDPELGFVVERATLGTLRVSGAANLVQTPRAHAVVAETREEPPLQLAEWLDAQRTVIRVK